MATYEDFCRKMHASQRVGILFKKAVENYERGELTESKAACEEILDLDGGHTGSLHLLGLMAHQGGNNREAFPLLLEAFQNEPDNPIYCNNLGTAFKENGDLEKAAFYFKKAVQLKPDFAEPHNNMGVYLKNMGKLEDAVSYLHQAVSLKPDFAEALNTLVDLLQCLCEWSELETTGARLDDLSKRSLAAGRGPAMDPLISLRRRDDLAFNLVVARSWSRQLEGNAARVRDGFSWNKSSHGLGRITVGYLSNNFGNHPVGHQISGLFALHNRDDFRIHCYSYGGDDGSPFRKQIEGGCDKFIDLSRLGYLEAAKRIHDDGVDILVDLVGHTRGNRLAICAMRPAPIQVSYLGFLGTTGAEFMDYIIADHTVIPEHQRPYYSEQPVYLPDCYQVNSAVPRTEKRFGRSDFGLPQDSFVFCCFNNAYKIGPVIFGLWIDILKIVPESLLWLLGENKVAEENLRREAIRRGMDPNRLYFSGRLPLWEHLERLKLADLALDTIIYNGGATTSNALQVGIPVITLQGNHFVSRMSSSALKAIGLPELITETLDEYKDLAVHLAFNDVELRRMKARLVKNHIKAPLFDTGRFCRNLEKAYRKMWKIFTAGEAPCTIEVN